MDENSEEFINDDFEKMLLEFTVACERDDFESNSFITVTGSNFNQPTSAANSNITNNQYINQNLPTTSSSISSQIPNSIQTGTNNILKEKKELTEEILILKGQHKITESKLKSQISSRDEEIKLLKEQLFKIQTESANSIKSLTSQLQFQEASLHGATQESMHIKAINDSLNESNEPGRPATMKMISTSAIRKRKQLEFDCDFAIKSQQPKKCRDLSFKDFDNFPKFSEIDVEKPANEHLNTTMKMLPSISKIIIFPETKSESNIDVKKSSNEHLDTTMKILPSTSKMIKGKYESQDVSNIKENKLSIYKLPSKENLETELSNISQIFDYTLNISYENDAWNLIGLAEFKSTIECCVPINYDNMFGFSVKAMHQVIPLFRSCMNMNYPEIIEDKSMNELLKLLSLQFERLCISMRKRKGSVDNMLDDVMGRKIFNKLDLMINPQYSCLYHYIYPASEVIKKMMHIAHYHSNYVGEFVMECLLPTLDKIINYFVIDFCCISSSKNDIMSHCRTYLDGVENAFLKKILIASIQMITLSSGSLKDVIRQKIFNCFKKLVPLFASKLNLKIVIIKLFCEMINFPMFLDMLSQHNAIDPCLMNIIMDILNCKCIREISQNELIEFSNNIVQIFYTLHLADFKWNTTCSCSIEMIMLINNISLNIARHISDTRWTEENKKSIQDILIVYGQLKMSFGASDYYKFLKASKPYEFFEYLVYLVDSQHPLLLELNWPMEFSWFYQLMIDTKYLYKK